nr:hypothetical protein [Tanacetum cinerariifolium]
MCFKAFTITAEVLKIFMQQFRYTIEKVKDLESYEFLLANKKCIVDAKVFKKILDINPRVEGDEFTKIDQRKVRKSRRETMPFPRFTKVIINHFLSQHKSLSKLQFQHYHTIKDDVIQDTSSAPKPEPATSKLKLKDVQSLTPEEQKAADIMQALKESKRTSKRHPDTEGSREGTSRILGVPDESTVIYATSSEETGTIPGVPDKEKVTSEENVILEWGSEKESEYSKEDQGDDEKVDWIDSDEDEEKKHDIDDDNTLTTLKSQVPNVVEHYLGSKITDDLQKVLQRHIVDLIQKYSMKPTPESSKIQKPTINLEQESKKISLDIFKIKMEQAEKQKMPKYTIKLTYKATLKEQHDDDDDDEDPLTGPNQGKKTKRRRTKEPESSKKTSTTKETLKGKAQSEGSKTGKSASAKEPVEEPILEVAMDDAVNTMGKDVVHDNDQPQDTSKLKTDKSPNQDWFKKPLRPLTLDPKWNKHQVVLDQSKQPRFNQMVFATKDPLTFNDLMDTLIDFSMYVLNRLKIDNLTQYLLLGTTCHLTVAIDYFFNNDLEYLKTSDLEKTYTTSITKTKETRYEIVGIKDMTLTLWSTIKHAYDKDVGKGIKHWGKRRKLWYKSQMNNFSKHNGYSTQKILEVVVKRVDGQLYNFKEGDFMDLHLNDLEDMLFLAVQHKIFHLNDSDIVDFIVALRMTLKTVRDELRHRILDFSLGYNNEMSRRKWTAIDKKRLELMVEFIDKQMRERRIIRNLKRLVSARKIKMDYKLMTQTV